MKTRQNKQIALSKTRVARRVIAQCEKTWPTRCMAKAVTGHRCQIKGYEFKLNENRTILLCKLHQDLIKTPDQIPQWPDEDPRTALIKSTLPYSENMVLDKVAQLFQEITNMHFSGNELMIQGKLSVEDAIDINISNYIEFVIAQIEKFEDGVNKLK